MEETSWLLCSFISLLIIVILWNKIPIKPNKNLPPSPGAALPFIGHLHLLKFPIHRTLRRLSDKAGPIFYLRLGVRPVVVVSSPALVEECFTTNDIVLANRPRLILGKFAGYDWTNLVAASYGDHWRNLRRLTTTEIFSSARLAVFRSIREDEARILAREIGRNSRHDYARVELRPLFSTLTFNIIMRAVAGKRCCLGKDGGDEEAREFRELIEEIMINAAVSNPVDYMPVFEWIHFSRIDKLRRLGQKTDNFLQRLIDEKHRNKANGGNTMIDHLLALQESDGQYYTDTIIKGIILVMFVAGTETSSVTLEWAMSSLLNQPEELDLARAEIDDVIADRLITESDISNLPYLRNIILETLRLYPAAPLLLPHEASDDCKIGGYDIPRGTMLLVNAWAIHRDPTIWNDPLIFRPGRFDEEEFGPAKLLPFGMGRRSCPGSSLANRMVGLTLGMLIQCFDWRRVGEGLVDVAEGNGLSMPKLVPLEAMCRTRGIFGKMVPGGGD